MSLLHQYANEISFIVCSILGGVMHYVKKRLRGETDSSMFQWYGNHNWMATFYTLVMFVFVTIGALAGGIVNSQTDIWAVLYTGFITGFAVDAGFNSDRSITGQLIEIKQEGRDLFSKDQSRYGGYGGYGGYGNGYGDQRGDLPHDEQHRGKTPVPGSPAVPPKHID